MDLILDSQFCSMDLNVWPCAGTVPSCSAVSFEIRTCESSYFILLFQDHFGYSGALEIPYELRNQLVSLYKAVSWGLDGDCTESVDPFGEYWHLNNINGAFQLMNI